MKSKTDPNNGRVDPDLEKRDDQATALAHYHRDVGMNYDASFGSLLDDSAASDVAFMDQENAAPKD
jgi:hypothetical protein